MITGEKEPLTGQYIILYRTEKHSTLYRTEYCTVYYSTLKYITVKYSQTWNDLYDNWGKGKISTQYTVQCTVYSAVQQGSLD